MDNARRGDAWMVKEFAHLDKDALVTLTLDHFMAPFVLLLIGLSSGAICCFLEFIYALIVN